MTYRNVLCFALMIVFSTGVAAGEKTRILLIGKNRDHPYATHEYMTDCRLLAKCLRQTKGVEAVVSNGWPKDNKVLKGVTAIALYTARGGDVILHPRARKDALQMLKNGIGYTAIHWSTDANKLNGPKYKNILGGWFSRPFAGSRLLTKKLTLTQAAPDHPICRGWKDYDLHDEYYLDLKFNAKARPVLTVNAQGKDHTVGWVFERPNSKGGRSFGCVCGHFHRNFAIRDFRKALVNGILWTARVEVPKAGAPVEITKQDLKLPPKK